MFGRLGYSANPLFSEFRRLEHELDELFGGSTAWSGGIRSLPPGTFPAVNVGNTEQGVSVYLFAPGVDPKSLEVTLQQNVLSVSGKREVAVEKDATYYRQERFSGTFNRVITLPDDVDAEKVEATYRDGVVQISVKRRESAKPRQIEIQ